MKKTIPAFLLSASLALTFLPGCHDQSAFEADQLAARRVADAIAALCVQTRTPETDAQCAAAKEAWDALTDAQKALVLGENADPDYFGLDTGDASLDDPLNADGIGEKEILVVSFGTSYNESRAADIGALEKGIAAAYPDWSTRRAFTSQIIINHVQARDGEKIDNVEQGMERAIQNGVRDLVVQPTLLMHGAEYDEAVALVTKYADQFDSVRIAEPLLGRSGSDASETNADKKSAVQAVVADAVAASGYESLDDAALDGVAFVLLGHGTSHSASVAYSQTQAAIGELGYKNVWIGTVEGRPESTACEKTIEAVAAAGYEKVVLRPFMIVAGDHAHNDMAGSEEDSWQSRFAASGRFEKVDVQIQGLGRLDAIRDMILARLADAMEDEE